MPHPLSLELIDYNARDAKTKHRSIVFSGLYCIGSPESEFWRVRFGKHKLSVKVECCTLGGGTGGPHQSTLNQSNK